MSPEDIIPLIIIFLVIFGSAIKKLLQKVAGQVEQSSADSSGEPRSGSASRASRPGDRSTTTSRSGRREEPIRLDRARKKKEEPSPAAEKRRSRRTRGRQTEQAQETHRPSTPEVTSVGEMQQERQTDRETGPGRPRGDRKARGDTPQLGGEEVGEGDASQRIEETEEVADRKWAETPPAAAPGKERTSETPVSGEELEEKIERRAGTSPLKKGIIWSEILGQPVSRRRRGGRLLPHQEQNN